MVLAIVWVVATPLATFWQQLSAVSRLFCVAAVMLLHTVEQTPSAWRHDASDLAEVRGIEE